MKVLEVRPLENCFDGSFMKELLLDHSIDADFIQHLGLLGELQYYPFFARPFFRVDDRHRFSIQGIEGNQILKVTFCRSGMEQWLSELLQAIETHQR